MKKITTLILTLILIQPFGCRTVHRIIKKTNQTTKIDSNLNLTTKVDVKTFDLNNVVKRLTDDNSKSGSKITYTKTEVTTGAETLDGVYSIDSIQPEDGSLNFTNVETGDKINVSKAGNKLKVVQKSNGTTKVKRVEQLSIENYSEKSSKKVDSSANNVSRSNSKGYSSHKIKGSKAASISTTNKDVERKGFPFISVIGVFVFCGAIWLVWKYFGKSNNNIFG